MGVKHKSFSLENISKLINNLAAYQLRKLTSCCKELALIKKVSDKILIQHVIKIYVT